MDPAYPRPRSDPKRPFVAANELTGGGVGEERERLIGDGAQVMRGGGRALKFKVLDQQLQAVPGEVGIAFGPRVVQQPVEFSAPQLSCGGTDAVGVEQSSAESSLEVPQTALAGSGGEGFSSEGREFFFAVNDDQARVEIPDQRASGVLCKRLVCLFSDFGEGYLSGEHDRELLEGSWPVLDRSFPFPRCPVQCQP